MKTSDKATGKENWVDVIPHRDDVYLQSYELFDDHLVLLERENGLRQMRIMRWDGSDEHYVDFGEPAYIAYIDNNPQTDTNVLRYGYSSLTTPWSIYDYDMEGERRP